MARVPRATSAGTLVVTVEGFDMPGRSCAQAGAAQRHENVHVGVQRGNEIVDPFPGDAEEARWSLAVTTGVTADGATDFGGPHVHGRRGDRFLYLSWGAVDGDFRISRRAKLHFADCDADVLAAAVQQGGLVCRVRMSDRWGDPRCGRVRPPDAAWTATSG
jgi:Family of unknown function (DUF5990)